MRFFFLTCLALVILSAPAQAGTWTRMDGSGGDDCGYLFSGEIQKGDITGFLTSERAQGVRVICLDSPGGDLGEVLDAIKVMKFDRTMGTRIRTGHQCRSACAILFLFGQEWGVSSPYTSRSMEPGAVLGFHSPFPKVSFTMNADAGSIMATAVEILDALYDGVYVALNGDGPPIAPEVLSMVLKTPADQMYVVNTRFELSMLGIDLDSPTARVGIPKTRKAFDTAVERICATSYIVTYRSYHLQEGYSFADLVSQVDALIAETRDQPPLRVVLYEGARPRVEALDEGGYWVPGWFSAGAALYCRVEFDVEVKGDMIWVNDYEVHFVSWSERVDDSIPEVNEQTRRGESVGLVPINTRY